MTTPASPTDAPLRAAIRPLLIGIVLISMFAFFFVYPAHDPRPRELPIALVGSGPVIDSVEARMEHKGFDPRRVKSVDDAREAILDREVYAAVAPTDGQVLVSSAASVPVSEIVRRLAESAPAELEVQDVRKVDADDPRGLSVNVAVLATTVPSILGAMLLVTMAPMIRGARRLAMLAALATLGGLASTLVLHELIGSIPGSFVAIWAVIALGIFAIAAASAAIIQLLGSPGVGLCFILFLMVGNPASGALGGRHLLPEPWRTGGQFLPPGAFGTGLRNTAYFDGAQLASWVGVLLAYALAGSAVVLLVGRRARPAAAPA